MLRPRLGQARPLLEDCRSAARRLRSARVRRTLSPWILEGNWAVSARMSHARAMIDLMALASCLSR